MVSSLTVLLAPTALKIFTLILDIFPAPARVTFAGLQVCVSGDGAGLVQAGFTQGLSTVWLVRTSPTGTSLGLVCGVAPLVIQCKQCQH